MAEVIAQFVPDEKEFWHYHKPSGLVVMNDPDYGWIAVASHDVIELMLNELTEVLNDTDEYGYMNPKEIAEDESIANYMKRKEEEIDDQASSE